MIPETKPQGFAMRVKKCLLNNIFKGYVIECLSDQQGNSIFSVGTDVESPLKGMRIGDQFAPSVGQEKKLIDVELQEVNNDPSPEKTIKELTTALQELIDYTDKSDAHYTDRGMGADELGIGAPTESVRGRALRAIKNAEKHTS